MKRGRRNLLIAVGCTLLGVVAVVVWLAWLQEREPEYQGRSLSRYLDVLAPNPDPLAADHSVVAAEQARARDAVVQIGTNALPYLVRWIASDEVPWQRKALRTIAKLPRPLKNLASLQGGGIGEYLVRNAYGPGPRDRAYAGFRALGSRASPALAGLVHILNDPRSSPTQKKAAMLGLSCIGEAGLVPLMAAVRNPKIGGTALSPEYFVCEMYDLGTNAIPIVPVVITWLTNQDPTLAEKAAIVLGCWRVQAELTVPALAKCVQDPTHAVRPEAVMALGKFGEEAKPAVPALCKALSDGRVLVRLEATNALMKIEPEALTNGVAK